MKINSRSKGRTYEQWIVNFIKAIGYTGERNSYVNKKADDVDKIDIASDFPFSIQAKAVERLSPSPHDILASMGGNKPKCLWWKRNNKGTVVCMTLDTFIDLIE